MSNNWKVILVSKYSEHVMCGSLAVLHHRNRHPTLVVPMNHVAHSNTDC